MDLRAARTRKLLFDAFVALIGERDYASITVSELCDKAMVRRATFYRHFKDKDDFFAAFVGKLRTDITEKIMADAEEDMRVKEYCRRMTECLADLIEGNEVFVGRMMISGSFDRLLGMAVEQVAADLGTHIERELGDDSARGVAAFYVGGLFGLIRVHLSAGGSFDRAAFLADHRRITDTLFAS